MSTEKFEKNLNYEQVVNHLESYHEMWFGNGYLKEYEGEGLFAFDNPFVMMDFVNSSGSDEEKYAAEVFEHTILQNSIGYQYLSRLEKKNPIRYQECIEKNADEYFWHTRDGRNLLSTYATSEGYLKESSISSILVKKILDQYLDSYDRLHEGTKREETLSTLQTTLDRYFLKHVYAHLGFWSKEENVYALYRYSKAGIPLPIDIIKSKHEQYTDLNMEDLSANEYKKNPEGKKRQYESFINILNVFEVSGFVENKYPEFREEFVKRFSTPKFIDQVKDDLVKENRKYKGIEILKQLGSFASNDESRFKEIAKEFLSNIAFDKDLYILVDTLRRYEKTPKKNKEDLGIKYKEVIENCFKNEKYLSWEWFRKEGSNVLKSMYEVSPFMYLDIVGKYIDTYTYDDEISDVQREEIARIIEVIFALDVKSKNIVLFNKYKELKDTYEKDRVNRIAGFILGDEDYKLKVDENVEFYEDTTSWTTYFKSEKFNKTLVELFNNDIDMFNFLIDNLMNHSGSLKESNYFDNVRMFNIVGKKLHEQSMKGVITVEDLLGEEREQIEERIVKDVRRLCTQPEVRVTVNMYEQEAKDSDRILLEYLKQYSEMVSSLDLDKVRISQRGNRLSISSRKMVPELEDAIKSLGLEFNREKNKIILKIGSRDEFFERVVGILVSPTLYEWAEDDKNNVNPKNEKLRTLFFVPGNIKVAFIKDDSEPFLNTSFSSSQRKYFMQHYLQWYLNVKYTAGDIKSSNTVISTWLADEYGLRGDLYNQGEQISKETARVWKDLEEALSITFEYERFRRSDILKKFLLAVNIEQLVPLLNEDRFQTALIASSILKSALDIAKEESVFRGIMQTSATLRNEFEGTTSLTYIAEEKRRRINNALKALGFNEGDEGLEMFRNMWLNFWYLRGFRGESQTLKITSAGIELSNPKRSMYEYERRIKETDKQRRRYGGGQDKLIISWGQIRAVNEAKIDMIPMKDIVIRIFTSFASITKQKNRPKIVTEVEKQGPGNIILKLPGRDEPLCEIFAIQKPMEFWKLLQDLSKLMMDEEASADALELLKVLQNN